MSLATALLLNRRFRGVAVLGVAVLLPWAIAPVVTGSYWDFMFNSHFGLATGIATVLGLTNGSVPWLEDSNLAMSVAVVASAWQAMPVFALILLASLKTIPDVLYRAAKIDGAGRWQSFRCVTIPAIRNTLLIVIVLSIISSLQIFAMLVTLTGGGPGRQTTVISYYIYLRAFNDLSLGYSIGARRPAAADHRHVQLGAARSAAAREVARAGRPRRRHRRAQPGDARPGRRPALRGRVGRGRSTSAGDAAASASLGGRRRTAAAFASPTASPAPSWSSARRSC